MSFIIALLLSPFYTLASKELVFQNKVYEPEIKSVQLYSAKKEIGSQLLPAVTQLHQNDLILEFDDLRYDYNSYYARIIHCQYDWTASTLRDLDFMTDYNEFNITDYAFSNNTQIPYVHYKVTLPKVKLSGNYLVVVYRNGNKSDIILSHRFMVFESRASLKQDIQTSGAINLRSTNQQMNFTIDYKGVEIINPFGSVHVVIRQNQRWDNARFDVKPSFVREDINQIEYRFFDNDKFFNAGNEFRFVDFRSVNFPGQNTDRVDKKTIPYHLWVQPDVSRVNGVYSQYPDINGQYFIENRDNGDDATASNYVDVTFTLKARELDNANVYLVGAFNHWIRNDESRMRYNTEAGSYMNTQLLKQGWYNYQYLVDDNQLAPNYFEGSHFETENFYEVFFYYRPFQPNADLLIGYFPISVNGR